MDRLPTTDVPGWLHTSLQGEVIAHGDVPVRNILSDTHTPVAIRPEHAADHPASEVELHRVSSKHGRSFEIGPNADRAAARLGKVAIWRDEFDNSYSSYSLKGNNFTYSTIFESSTAPSGYIPMGLLESDALLRVVRSSRLLREAGVSTEWINRVFEPQTLIYKGEAVSQAEYKKRLLHDTANTRGLEEMAKIAAAIEPMTFFITGRSMEINDRLADFATDTPESGRKRLQRIFSVYNATHSEDDDFRRLQPAREADRVRFFNKIFPSLLGTSMAKLHNADLVHTFPTLSNVTILGGVIDLDSIRGVPLGMDDKPITVVDRANDIATITDYDEPVLEMRMLYAELARMNIIPRAWDVVTAQAQLVDTYNSVRTPLRRKEDRLIETMAISGANWSLDGYLAYNSYKGLATREARKALNLVWEGVSELISEGWSDENVAQSARYAIDIRLEYLTKQAESDTHFELTEELLAPAFVLMEYDSNHLDEAVRDKYPQLAEAIDSKNELPKLNSFIPDKAARLRVLQALVEATSRHVSREMVESTGEDALMGDIRKIFDDEVKAFLEKMKPTDWQILAHTHDAFKVARGIPADRFMIYEQKGIYGFDAINFESLIASTLDANIPIYTSTKDASFNAGSYMFPSDGFIARNGFSDGNNYRLMRLTITDSGRKTAGSVFPNSDQDITYFAWLCEKEEDGSHALFVYSDNSSQIDAMIKNHPKTNSTHTVLSH